MENKLKRHNGIVDVGNEHILYFIYRNFFFCGRRWGGGGGGKVRKPPELKLVHFDEISD